MFSCFRKLPDWFWRQKEEYLAFFRNLHTVPNADVATYSVVTGVISQGEKRLMREVYHPLPPYIEVRND